MNLNCRQCLFGGQRIRFLSRNARRRSIQAPNVTMNVALVGRPNVGKSTLFNRLTRSRGAIVTDIPGTTRDRKVGRAVLSGVEMELVDTGGLDERDRLTQDIQTQVEAAIVDSDVVMFMVDAKAGITPMDRHYAKWIRKYIGLQPHIDPNVVLVANKTEGSNLSDVILDSIAESQQLGLGKQSPHAGIAPPPTHFSDLALPPTTSPNIN